MTSRSVLEALLKRGSSVVLVCSEADGQLGRAEVARLRWAAVSADLLLFFDLLAVTSEYIVT